MCVDTTCCNLKFYVSRYNFEDFKVIFLAFPQVAADLEYARNMYELHKKVNPAEIIVGW